MVSPKFLRSLCVVILVMLCPQCTTSSKYYLRGPGGSPMFVEGERGSTTSFTKGNYDGTPNTAEMGYKRHSVVQIMRKMMAKRVLAHKDGENNISGCSQIVNNNNNSKTMFNVKCSFRVKNYNNNNNNNNFKSKMDNFVAFNADYNVPRPHPPKNN